jgi:hypothetical protein
MRNLTSILLIALLAVSLGRIPTRVASMATEQDAQLRGEGAASGHRYPDFGFLPPPSQYEGRVFHLSQDYPQKLPDADRIPAICKTDMNDFKQNWRKYLMDVRAYCFRGNVLGGDVEDDWVVQNNKCNPWYHMPWQHYGSNGREGIHGLTKEAPVQPRQLAWSQTYTGGQTYAVGFYNEFGGYTIGQVWKDHEHPDDSKSKFPVGTVVCKVLFVDLPPAQVPFLNPPLVWQGYITDNYLSNNRSIRNLSLIQMDIMVRHETAPTGWLFGTFQYNGKAKADNPWERLVPVGLMWGNDPDVTDDVSNPQPVQTIINPKIKESVINPDTDELPPTHLGWNGRLNGPVDNPMSSCMSCHMTAEVPQKSQMSPLFSANPPAPGSKEWMRWFQNNKCGERFDKDKPTKSTDFSLQMSIALQNFRTWRDAGSKIIANRYKSAKVTAQIKQKREPLGPNMIETADQGPVVEIRRDYPKQEKP